MDSISTAKNKNLSDYVFNGIAKLLMSIVWISTFIFGIYIIAFYGFAIFDDDMTRWNKVLPKLYEPDNLVGTISIGIHFFGGGLILILGCIQFLDKIRTNYPVFHRWTGRIYIGAALLTAIGGLLFIALKGTIGGAIMDIGFGLYGLLTFWAAIETIRHARAKRFVQHRAWGMRLFALAIGSWLYRMDYGFWFILMDGVGHTKNFSGWFDQVMAFFFYVPNLIIVEILIRKQRTDYSTFFRTGASVILGLAILFLMIGTYFFTRELWGPAILNWIGL